MNRGEYECICLIGSYWDLLGLLIMSGLAMYGILMIVWQIRNKRG